MISESGHWDPLRSRWRWTDSRLDGGTLENVRVQLNFRFEGHIYKLVPDGHRHSSHQAGVHLSKNTPKVLNKHSRLYTFRFDFIIMNAFIIYICSKYGLHNFYTQQFQIYNEFQSNLVISYLRGLQKFFNPKDLRTKR